MLINFALDILGTKISSDKVSTDDHECSNLISSNWHLRRKGFLAEYFIKPPVNITFEFPCNVCIHHILVTPCVGQQLSSHLELYSASKLQSRAATYFKKQKTVALEGGCGISNASAVSHSVPAIFYPVSKMYLTDSDRICFYNPKVSASLSTDTAYNGVSYHHRTEIRHFRQEIISASSHLTLRIMRTVSGSTAAVSSIDIWGLPALSVPTAVKDDIANKYTSFINQSSAKKDSEIFKHENKTGSTAASSSVTHSVAEIPELEIPEDFLDSITCEVMAMPMLLPSGKNVDQSTLDHYFNVEASYCRQPRDPFTGIEFSSTNKPIPNGALKTRIDKFLMEHSDDVATSTIARTVRAGRNTSLLGKRKKTRNANDGVSSLISPSCSSQQLFHTTINITGRQVFQLEDSTSLESQKSETVSQPNNLDKSKNACSKEVSGDAVKCQQTSYSCNIPRNDFADHPHETQLKSSLNNALSSILSSLPSYLSNSQSSADNDVCSLCKGTLIVHKASYVTPCHHYMCRECLTLDRTVSSITCGVCGHSFTTSHVLRRHQAV